MTAAGDGSATGDGSPGTRVGAVVVNYRSAPLAVACVASLRSEVIRDVVVVDNDSGDDVETLLRTADPDARFLQTGANLGFGGGANRGAATLTNELLLICNPDLVVEPGTVKALVEAMDRDPGLGIVGPMLANPDGSMYPSARTFPDLADAVGHAFLGVIAPANPWSRRYKMLDWDHAGFTHVDWVSGACFLIRRSLWEQLGGFDESYFMYLEDVDLCWRAGRGGWRVGYEPSGRVVHEQGASTDQRPYRMITAHHRSMLLFARRTTTGPRRALIPLMAAALGLRVALASSHRWWSGLRR